MSVVMLQLTSLAVLFISLAGQELFICNNYKFQDQCVGATASDGVCGWNLFGCSAVAPLPPPAVVQVEAAPPIVCPPYTAEAACNSDPCVANPICFTNNEAQCIVNNCIGEFEYLDRTLKSACTAVFVDVASQSVVDCNVKEIIREVDQAALEQYQLQQTEQQEGVPAETSEDIFGQAPLTPVASPPVSDVSDLAPVASPTASGMSFGLPQLTTSDVVELPSAEEATVADSKVPMVEPVVEDTVFAGDIVGNSLLGLVQDSRSLNAETETEPQPEVEDAVVEVSEVQPRRTRLVSVTSDEPEPEAELIPEPEPEVEPVPSPRRRRRNRNNNDNN
eukprot:TRINITY_DN4728_c0_g1_i1.p1 TRINITY_DN4728_c0_g1~~TRINITY_DN4728_c0_g1_i1.p1  ORF type:complete len:334 (-),score=93.54 TRINITY_DN4728_c0_g1_i1:2587-3588(-)